MSEELNRPFKRYLFDTSVLLGLERFHKGENEMSTSFSEGIKSLSLDQSATQVFISSVSIAELAVFINIRKWEEMRKLHLVTILKQHTIIPLSDSLIPFYREVDLYSRGMQVHKTINDNTYTLQMTKGHRRMGKNDLWIAAIAYQNNCSLVTCDNDFNHLALLLNEVIIIPYHSNEVEKYKKNHDL